LRVEITFTGTGTGHGVPVIGCDCPVCTGGDPRNRRLRCGAVLRFAGRTVAVDTPPDMRAQCLAAGVTSLDAVLYTHEHADHIHGIDDIRRFNQIAGGAIAAYAPPGCAAALRERFGYATRGASAEPSVAPGLEVVEVTGPFEIGGATVTPVPLVHGRMDTFGYRVGPLAYLTDLKELPDASRELVRGLDLLVLDALRPEPHPMHLSFDEAIELARELSPRRTYLTHMTHHTDYAAVEPTLPDGVHLAYDGLTVWAEG